MKWALVIAVVILLAASPFARASSTGPERVKRVVRNWMLLDPKPLGCALGQRVREVRTFADVSGLPLYHAAFLEPDGLVIVSGDDLVEPIIAFAPKGIYDPYSSQPLADIVSRDAMQRVARVRSLQSGTQTAEQGYVPVGPELEALRKWRILDQDSAPSAADLAAGLPSVSDERIPILLNSRWGQGNEGASWCYNYYTPNHWLSGCAATALAQLMCYHQWPTAGVGAKSVQILVWNSQTSSFDIVTVWFRGGDGSGGPYDWAKMTPDPDAATSDPERRAIGALTYDAGISINTHYHPNVGDAIIANKKPLVNHFSYGNMIHGDAGALGSANIACMANPNLDAKLPVVMRITGTAAHFVVCDGYGYNAGTVYHHLNLGWYGGDDAWYNLPDIGTGYNFNLVTSCWYNIYKSGSGEIISGRVLHQNGSPMENVLITAMANGSAYYTFTNSRGIYAFAGLPSGTTVIVTATMQWYEAEAQVRTTGYSMDNTIACGNHWGVNFTLTPSSGIHLPEALDNHLLSFASGGSGIWFGEDGNHFYGRDAAQSGRITHNQTTWMQTTVKGPATLSFFWKVSSEKYFDRLELYLGGSLQGSISGEQNWEWKTLAIPAGTHFVKWVYTKDPSISIGADCGWVDKVGLVPARRVLMPPLLALFPFEGNTKDVSGNNRHGTASNVSMTEGVEEGQSYYFDGGASFIEAPLDINPSSHPKLTMGAWVKPASTNPVRQVLSCDDGGYDRSLGIDDRGGGSGWSAFCGSGSVLGSLYAAPKLWTFVAVVYDQAAGAVKLYAGGNNPLSKNGILGDGLANVRIGANPTYGEYFHGSIDNVFFFADVLTEEQIEFVRYFGSAALLPGPAKKPVPAIADILLLD